MIKEVLKALITSVSAGLLLVILLPNSTYAGEVKVMPDDGGKGDYFGYSIAFSENYAIVGAPGFKEGQGSAYIYKRDGNNWKQLTKLTADDSNKDDWFGAEVAITDDYAIVGSPWDDDLVTDCGSVYFYKRLGESNWKLESKAYPNHEFKTWCNFGIAISVQGDYAVIGSWQEHWAQGAFYIYKHDGNKWVDTQGRIVPKEIVNFDTFAGALCMDGDWIVLGASMSDHQAQDGGAAYFYKREGESWVEKQMVFADDPDKEDFFGTWVYLSGDYAIITATGDDAKGTNSGSAYIFHYDGASWKQEAKLTPEDNSIEKWFGGRSFISDKYAIVGSSLDNVKGAYSGASYVYVKDGTSWKQVKKLVAKDEVDGDRFGGSVAVRDNYVAIGSWKHDGKDFDSGAVYIYPSDDLLIPNISVKSQGKLIATWGKIKDKLYQNYPNPFNPETWIPFTLFDDGQVMLEIYDSNQQLVRTINLGIKPAGDYLTRDKAIYWDGKNDNGEKLTSGVYFYTIKAGDFAESRKMVILR